MGFGKMSKKLLPTIVYKERFPERRRPNRNIIRKIDQSQHKKYFKRTGNKLRFNTKIQ